jgi:segregation and condensation protein A
MEEKEKDAEWVIERKRLQHSLPFDDEGLWEKVDVWDLLRIFTELTPGLSQERIIDLYEEVSVNEKITFLYEILERKGECRFTDLIVKISSVMDKVCAFLALLEVVKQRMVLVFQNRMFVDIVIRPNDRVFYDGLGISKRNSAD